MFSNCLIPFEPLVPCSYILSSLSHGLLLFVFLWSGFPLVLKFSSPFGAVCSCVFKFPNAFGAVCSLFLNCVVSFGLCAAFSTVPSPLRAVCSVLLKCSRLFRLACSSFSLSPTVFARFARSYLTLVSVAWFVLGSPIVLSLSSGLLRFLNPPVLFERFAPCSEIV